MCQGYVVSLVLGQLYLDDTSSSDTLNGTTKDEDLDGWSDTTYQGSNFKDRYCKEVDPFCDRDRKN